MKTFVLFFLFAFTLHNIVACSNKKDKIVDQIRLYRDSLGVGKVQLYLVDTASEHGATYIELEKMREPIKERIYRYHYKLDSLELELKKY